jgi:Spx/MgsR family transcriptional regulator
MQKSVTTVAMFGIPHCDTVKKARAWLEAHGVAHTFHDFKKSGVPADRLAAWIGAAGWEKVLNRQGTTWRSLDAARQAAIVDVASAAAALEDHPSMIKRPVVEWPPEDTSLPAEITVGFHPGEWAQRLSA